jgi:hypothetical protein
MSTVVNNNSAVQQKQNQGFPIEHFKCEICQGYIIDATTLSDCLHPCNYIVNK